MFYRVFTFFTFISAFVFLNLTLSDSAHAMDRPSKGAKRKPDLEVKLLEEDERSSPGTSSAVPPVEFKQDNANLAARDKNNSHAIPDFFEPPARPRLAPSKASNYPSNETVVDEISSLITVFNQLNLNGDDRRIKANGRKRKDC